MINLESDFAEFDAAYQRDQQKAAEKEFGGDKVAAPEEGGGFVRWMKKLPENITVGLIDAAVNTYDTMAAVGEAAGEGEQIREAADKGAPASQATPNERRMATSDAVDGPVRSAVLGVRNIIAERADGTADTITQAAAQFMIPFMGWSKAFGGLQAATKIGTVARAGAVEASTIATAFDPHAGRLADLAALGKQSEGSFADVLNAAAPDGSALNAYIDYMSNHEDESDAEGRFKNVVDGLTGSAAIAGLIKVSATAFKSARRFSESPIELPEIGAPTHLQEGYPLEVFHGTAHNFESFDLSKVGTGEGSQVFGHGIYLAENEAVAKAYRGIVGYKDSVRQFRQELPDDAEFEEILDLASSGGLSSQAARVVKALAADDWLGFDNPAQAISAAFRDAKNFEFSAELRAAIDDYGNLYTAEIPDEAVAKMLDYDRPLSEQPHVLKALKGTKEWRVLLDDWKSISEGEGTEREMLESITGGEAYDILSGKSSVYDPETVLTNAMEPGINAAATSNRLRELGIPGLKYLDQGSRKAEEGTRNLVVFDDKLARITKKNGQPIVNAEAQQLAAQTLEQLSNNPPSALVQLTEQADNAIDDAERIKFLAAAQTVRKQLPDTGVTVVPSPEGHTVVVGKQPLVTFLDENDAAEAVSDYRRQFGGAFERRAAAEHVSASDANFGTLHSFSRVLASNKDRPVSTHSLLSALEHNLKGDTEQGAFYKELLGRLVRKKLGGTTTVSSKPGRHENSAGHYATAFNTIELYDKAFRDTKTLLHTYAHEAVHAATIHEINASPRVFAQMEKLRKTTQAVFETQADAFEAKNGGRPGRPYGFTNAAEFVAEIEANPEFRKLMQKTKLEDGGTAWDKYLETIAGILGLSSLVATPAGLKEFSKLMMGDKQEEQSA